METLNKNWFAFTLIAVIFAALGYFFGKQNKTHHCCAMQKHAKCSVVSQKHHMIKPHKNDESIKNVEIEEMENENGDKTIKVKVKKEEEKP